MLHLDIRTNFNSIRIPGMTAEEYIKSMQMLPKLVTFIYLCEECGLLRKKRCGSIVAVAGILLHGHPYRHGYI